MPNREPSIHISFKVLKKLILDWGDQNQLKSKVMLSSALASYILSKSRKYSLRHRSILESNAKIAQRTDKLRSSSKSDAMEFSEAYTLIRRKMKWQGVKNITDRDGVQWDYINQAAGLARSFANDFNMNFKEGCTQYITIALNMIKPWSINKFKMADERIRNYKTALQALEDDPNRQQTSLMYDMYQAKVAEKTGQTIDYLNNPGEYMHFIEASRIAKEIQVHAKYYITAQFEQLDWTNGFPTPSQLASFKARERAIRWMVENNIRLKQQQRKLTKGQEAFMKRHATND